MLFSLCPQSVLAETSTQDSGAVISAGGLCKHHSEHDEDCGYTEGTAGFPCTYEPVSYTHLGIYGGILEKNKKINGVKVEYYKYADITYAIWEQGGFTFSYIYTNDSGAEVETIIHQFK